MGLTGNGKNGEEPFSPLLSVLCVDLISGLKSLSETNKQTMKCILRSIVWDGCRKEITRRFFFVFSFLHPNLIFKNVLSRPFDLHNSRSPICIWLLFFIVLTVAVNCCCFTVTSISTVYLSSHA